MTWSWQKDQDLAQKLAAEVGRWMGLPVSGAADPLRLGDIRLCVTYPAHDRIVDMAPPLPLLGPIPDRVEAKIEHVPARSFGYALPREKYQELREDIEALDHPLAVLIPHYDRDQRERDLLWRYATVIAAQVSRAAKQGGGG